MTLREKAIKLAWLINDEGHKPSEALAMLGFDWEAGDFYTEDDSIFTSVDDPQNDLIDLSWENGESITLRRTFKAHTDQGRVYVWEVHAMRRLTNYQGDPNFKEVTP